MELISKILFFFRRKNNIIIGGGTKISSDAVIETVHGGEIRIGKNCEILNGAILMTYGGKIEVGDRCSINPYTILYGHGGLKIGNDVLIAGHTIVIPANHIYTNRNKTINTQGLICKGITIEDDVWIGGGCCILDGITIGKGSIIAAGAVVNTSVAPFSVVGGVPIKLLKKRE
jgi:acetyltransferase-like isoleucine patch superfamily enzyme